MVLSWSRRIATRTETSSEGTDGQKEGGRQGRGSLLPFSWQTWPDTTESCAMHSIKACLYPAVAVVGGEGGTSTREHNNKRCHLLLF